MDVLVNVCFYPVKVEVVDESLFVRMQHMLTTPQGAAPHS